MSGNARLEVINAIMDQLKANLRSQNLTSSLGDSAIKKRILKTIQEAENWSKSKQYLMANLPAIAEKRSQHGVEFDITGKSIKSVACKLRYSTDEPENDTEIEVKTFLLPKIIHITENKYSWKFFFSAEKSL